VNGFLNLISVLLDTVESGHGYKYPSAPQPGAIQPVTELPQTASANAPSLPFASHAEIAQALIRSMLGGKTTPATPVFDRAKTTQAKAGQASGGPGKSPSALPIASLLPVASALPTPESLPITASAAIPASAPTPASVLVPAPLLTSVSVVIPAPGPPKGAPVEGPSMKAAMTAGSPPAAQNLAGTPASLPISAFHPPLPAPLSLPEGGAPVDRPSVKAAVTVGSPPAASSLVGDPELQGTGAGVGASAAPLAVASRLTLLENSAVATPLLENTPTAALAFVARLTLLENGAVVTPPAENTPAAPPVESPSTAKSKAVEQESFSPRGPLLRNNTSDAAVPVAGGPSTSPSDGFARGFENPAPPNTALPEITDAKPSIAFGTVADSLRTSEIPGAASSPAASAATNSPVQEIAVRIAQPAMPVVDLQVTERAGEIRVAVRTPDPSLETLLREDLGTLTNSLERAGYRAETYFLGSHEEGPKAAASRQTDFSAEEERSRQGSSTGHPGGSPQGEQQQRQRHHNAQDWNDEMEKQQ
jgi:hypothetical protein